MAKLKFSSVPPRKKHRPTIPNQQSTPQEVMRREYDRITAKSGFRPELNVFMDYNRGRSRI